MKVAVDTSDTDRLADRGLVTPVGSVAIAPRAEPVRQGAEDSATAVDATPALLVDKYLATLQSDHSYDTMRDSLRRIARLMGRGDDERSFGWHRLSFEGMQDIRERLAAAYPPGTANLSLSAMRQMLRVGSVLGLVSDDQRRALDLVKNVRGSRLTKGRALPDDELAALWTCASSTDGAWGMQLRAQLSTFVGAGARREEMCDLLVSGFHGDELRIVGKGNKERMVPIDTWTSARLEEWISRRRQLAPGHARLFCTLGRPDLRPVKPWALWFTVRELAARAGVVDALGRPTLSPHDFRRTFATRLLEQGFDLGEVQKLMGHESPATTARYDKRAERRLAEKRRVVRVFVFEKGGDECVAGGGLL